MNRTCPQIQQSPCRFSPSRTPRRISRLPVGSDVEKHRLDQDVTPSSRPRAGLAAQADQGRSSAPPGCQVGSPRRVSSTRSVDGRVLSAGPFSYHEERQRAVLGDSRRRDDRRRAAREGSQRDIRPMSDQPTSSAWVIEATSENFQREVIERSSEVPVVIDFWAEWCGPCRMLGPVLERLAAEYDGRFVLAKVDTEREPGLAADFGVRSIPAVFAVRDGQAVDGFVGVQPEAAIKAWLDRLDAVSRRADRRRGPPARGRRPPGGRGPVSGGAVAGPRSRPGADRPGAHRAGGGPPRGRPGPSSSTWSAGSGSSTPRPRGSRPRSRSGSRVRRPAATSRPPVLPSPSTPTTPSSSSSSPRPWPPPGNTPTPWPSASSWSNATAGPRRRARPPDHDRHLPGPPARFRAGHRIPAAALDGADGLKGISAGDRHRVPAGAGSPAALYINLAVGQTSLSRYR